MNSNVHFEAYCENWIGKRFQVGKDCVEFMFGRLSSNFLLYMLNDLAIVFVRWHSSHTLLPETLI